MFQLAAAGAGTADAAGSAGAAGLLSFLPMILIFVVMYVILIVPQRKREKKTKEMINAVKVGDTITTIGGIRGKIINIKDDEVTVESGVEKAKLQFKKWAIKEVDKPIEG